jgi:hypothetical protein
MQLVHRYGNFLVLFLIAGEIFQFVAAGLLLGSHPKFVVLALLGMGSSVCHLTAMIFGWEVLTALTTLGERHPTAIDS